MLQASSALYGPGRGCPQPHKRPTPPLTTSLRSSRMIESCLLALFLCLGLFRVLWAQSLHFLLVPAVAAKLGQEFANTLLIQTVFGILASAYALSERCTSLKDEKVGNGTAARPVVHCVRLEAGPLIEDDP
ncbi:hypothetical protein CB0940_00665 [Cercospora beticola]|uniref:Uncharacterized protein n=1 Tax=Cercospora beticola TaxID=122368 RepID=A0A2G5IA49_CERBT|nr:hypothetical protein CB0940_00665 [Cercospora beticola]PIB01665.1 hypothetical protein CB0940_00665 [Cercospora beticola]